MESTNGLDVLGAWPETRYMHPTIYALIGAVLGGLAYKRNRPLGLFAGSAFGAGLSTIINGGSIWDVAQVGALAASGYGISRLWKKHPIPGFLAGAALGEIAIRKAGGESGFSHIIAGDFYVNR